MLEYWAPHQDPENKTTEQDFIAASTLTLDGLVREVRSRLAERTSAEGWFRADTIPGQFYLQDKPAVEGARILHRVPVPRPAEGGHRVRPKFDQVASYDIFQIPGGLSSSMTLRLEEQPEPGFGSVFLYRSDGSLLRVPSNPAADLDRIDRRLAEAAEWEKAEQAERRLGLDFLSEADAQRLAAHIAAAQPL